MIFENCYIRKPADSTSLQSMQVHFSDLHVDVSCFVKFISTSCRLAACQPLIRASVSSKLGPSWSSTNEKNRPNNAIYLNAGHMPCSNIKGVVFLWGPGARSHDSIWDQSVYGACKCHPTCRGITPMFGTRMLLTTR